MTGLTLCAALCFGLNALAQSPPPPPAISAITPDRTAPGDLITISGEGFAVSSEPVLVNFSSSGPVSVTPAGEDTILVTVPPGAKTGPVTVTTTATHEGQPLVQTSNAADILVVWKRFDMNRFGLYAWDFYRLVAAGCKGLLEAVRRKEGL